ncbi:MAG TPA: glyoxalase [Acetobacteraceae bacterium]|jgi:catechol 2,3-dioxygenase|nr:glyoxalase [Acetobacteraceae bacterium]
MGTIRARLSHVGIHAQDKPRLERFYTTVLGLMVTDSGKARSGMDLTFMSADPANHHQFVLVSGRPDTSGFNPINQISFMVDSLADLREVHRRALENGATEMRVLSHGNAWSCYFKDPEGNVVEAYLDTPWHVPQPHGDPLDLSKSDEDIIRETEAICRADPGFMMIEDYQRAMAQRLAG